MEETKMAGAQMLDDEMLADAAGGSLHAEAPQEDAAQEYYVSNNGARRPAFSMCFYCWKLVRDCTCRKWNKNF